MLSGVLNTKNKIAMLIEQEDLELQAEDASDKTVEINGTEMFEHFRFVADKGQQLLRVDGGKVGKIVTQ